MADDFELIKNPKGKSIVWEHFSLKRKRDDDEISYKVAYCRHCQKTVQCCGGTTNLRMHLERHHKFFFNQVNQPSCNPESSLAVKKEQPTLFEVFKKAESYKPTSDRHKLLTGKVANFIIKDMRPFSIVNNEGFRSLVNTLDPKYSIPSKTYFSETAIPAMYETLKLKIKAELSSIPFVALTTDGWTSRATESYITITVSFINNDWCMSTYVLQTRALPISHTGTNIAEVISQAICEWGLPQNPPLVTDNAANMGVAAREVGCDPHLPCYAHTLNLAVQKSLKLNGVSRLLGRVRKVVAFFHRSTTANALLKEKSKLLGVREVKLIHDVCTRWNSAVDMLERFLELQPAVYAVLISKELKSKDSDVSTLNEDDIKIAEQITTLLIPIRAVSVVLCSETTPTASVILPVQKKLLDKELSEADTDPPIIKQMKATIAGDLKPRYASHQEFLEAASLLDPRFKVTFLSEEQASVVTARVTAAAATLSPTRIKQEPGNSSIATEPNVKEEPPLLHSELTGQDDKKQSVGLASILGDVVVTKAEKGTKSVHAMVKEEMNTFLASETLPLGSNPLLWWKEESWRLPHLAVLARKLLCIPATSVSSERVFSSAGDIVSAQRATLGSEKVDMLLFLKKNM